jgi:hypothetical protein
MQRTFNYTDRLRILHEDVKFSLRQESGRWGFDATLKLDAYELPVEGLIFVEAYRQTTWMRFDFGTIGNCIVPPERQLTEFDSPEDILFRVRVTSPGTVEEPHGLLLAEANRVPLRGADETENPVTSLLPVIPSDLGAEVWKLDFEDRPRLLLNGAAGNYKQVGLEPGFVAVVYPAALREILYRILHREKYRSLDDSDDWRARWLRFAADILGVGEPPETEDDPEADDIWIDGASAAFASKHALLDKFRMFWTEGEK